MSTDEYILNIVLLVYILWTGLGTKPLTSTRFIRPLVLIAIAAAVFLRSISTGGHDERLELAGVLTGFVLGTFAGLLVRVERDRNGQLVTRAGAAYAAIWIAVIGGRVLFAYGADHWFTEQIDKYSMTHEITSAEAWADAFILMSLTMLLTRLAVTGVAAIRASRTTSGNAPAMPA